MVKKIVRIQIEPDISKRSVRINERINHLSLQPQRKTKNNNRPKRLRAKSGRQKTKATRIEKWNTHQKDRRDGETNSSPECEVDQLPEGNRGECCQDGGDEEEVHIRSREQQNTSQ